MTEGFLVFVAGTLTVVGVGLWGFFAGVTVVEIGRKYQLSPWTSVPVGMVAGGVGGWVIGHVVVTLVLGPA